MLAKLVVAFRAKLSLSLDIVFSLGDRRVLGNIGQMPAQNAAIHLLPSGAVGTRAAVSFPVQIDNIICHIQPHFSIGVGAGEGGRCGRQRGGEAGAVRGGGEEAEGGDAVRG